MTVATEVARNDYLGSGATDTFDYDFQIYDETDLLVTTRVLATNVETTLSYPTDYAVTGVGNAAGGTITLSAGNLAATHALSIRFHTTLTQETDLRNQGSYHPDAVEAMGDRSVKIDQQQQDEIDRTLKLGETLAAVDTMITSLLPGYYLRLNAGGTAVEGVSAVADSGSFLQSGVGAVSRSNTSKISELGFSVKDFDVVGSGDETVKIQKAMEAAWLAGRVLVFPEGTYSYVAASAPAGTNHAPAMRGIGNVTINITGAVQWRITNGFSQHNINFRTTHTYSNATADFNYTFSTGDQATAPILENCVLRDITFYQDTITDGSQRGFGYTDLSGGVTNLVCENIFMRGIRHGITLRGDGHNRDAIAMGATFRNIHGENMQRIISPGSPGYAGGQFASERISIENVSLVNTATQRDNYSGGDRVGKSPIIGDMGIGGSIMNFRVQHPIEHACYLYGQRLMLDKFYGANPSDIKLIGYGADAADRASGTIIIDDYRVSSAPWSASIPIVMLQYVDGVHVDVRHFKGTNASGGEGGHLIRPWAVVQLSRTARNVHVTARGQYLLQGVVNYDTQNYDEAYENITVQGCNILDPHTTTAANGYAALKMLDATDPNAPPHVKNVKVLDNYFGVTAETADVAETTDLIGRGRAGTKLNGLLEVVDMEGVLCERNTVDGWASLYSTIAVTGTDIADVVVRETFHIASAFYFSTALANCPKLSAGSHIKWIVTPSSGYRGGEIEVVKGYSSGASATTVEAITAECKMRGTITLSLATTDVLAILTTANFTGSIKCTAQSGEYTESRISNGAIVGLHESANADADTDTALKLSTYVSSGAVNIKNSIASTQIVTIAVDGAYYS